MTDKFCLAGWPDHLDREQATRLRDDLAAFLSYHESGRSPATLVVGDVVRITERPFYMLDGKRYRLEDRLVRVGETGEVIDGPDGDGDFRIHLLRGRAEWVNGACLEHHG